MRFTFLLFISFLFSLTLQAQTTFPVNGVADVSHIRYAFINATIIIDYQTKVDSASLIIRDGLIEEVGKNISIPKDAVIKNLQGKYIYPSFIDMYTGYGVPEYQRDRPSEDRTPQFISQKRGAYSWNQAVKPEVNADAIFNIDSKKAEEFRKMGFGSVLSHQMDGIMRGTGVFVLLSDENVSKLVIKEKASSHYSFEKGSSTQDYPSSLMGAIALVRQTYYDARWYKQNQSNQPDYEFNLSLEALNNQQDLPQIFEVSDKLTVLRAMNIAKEFGLKYIMKGAGDEYQRIEEIKAEKCPLIIPLNFPAPFELDDPFDALQISLGEMKDWELAPSNPFVVSKAGIPFALTSANLKDKKDFFKNIRKAIDRGLSEKEALRALTSTPSELLKVSDQVGALKKGMRANFLITSKNIFDKENMIFENWVGGKQYQITDPDIKDIRGNYDLKISSLPVLKMKAEGSLMEPKITLEDDTAKAKASFSRVGKQINISFELQNIKPTGIYRLSGFQDGENNWKGRGQLPSGEWIDWTAGFTSVYIPEEKKDSIKKEKLPPGEVTYPNKAFGWKELPKAHTTLIKNCTVWTNEKEGVLKNTDVLFKDGKIVQVRKNISASDSRSGNALITIDGTGKHLTAGIVDEHSHIAISRGVNEGTQAVTSEVRIGDVVNSDDVNIYRALAGGVTSTHLLHGSANPIGGQTQLIKLRWGLAPEKLKFERWPGFIKFALGENVKQSNWGDKQVYRFPQTRMGVEQVYVDAFTRAKEYEQKWKNIDSKSKSAIMPRKNLELDALVEIMNAKRFITCHSYVQSEINMLMHVADSMGFKVNTFTHILEGYKVADKMKKHGAGASTFSDWWAYKFEVMEAIPYNATILHDEGLTVAINSDDAEMGRRLNQEAAKTIKYGGMSEEEALKMVTLNPAQLLHVDQFIGSIKTGKDADLVLWSDNPLSVYAKAQMTWVDGVLYFDYEKEKVMQDEIRKEKSRIVNLMMDAKKAGEKTQKPASHDDELYHCDTELEHY